MLSTVILSVVAPKIRRVGENFHRLMQNKNALSRHHSRICVTGQAGARQAGARQAGAHHVIIM
jgi:hypothetical protein